jgi:hypothetical protein
VRRYFRGVAGLGTASGNCDLNERPLSVQYSLSHPTVFSSTCVNIQYRSPFHLRRFSHQFVQAILSASAVCKSHRRCCASDIALYTRLLELVTAVARHLYLRKITWGPTSKVFWLYGYVKPYQTCVCGYTLQVIHYV